MEPSRIPHTAALGALTLPLSNTGSLSHSSPVLLQRRKISELSIDRVITVTLRHKQMCQPLKFALVNVSAGNLDSAPR
ncbi:hypothetical protein Q7C36_020519 [Tachysurus vachellii]|uniref:Uncharacterized protein n=1 Tax=Tachysurus vachellii TaxID=175792 RepID=A0AA88IUB3_TACVA|nr:hypothetical protein Q7C36_020519 [Tachysurus vachellii]